MSGMRLSRAAVSVVCVVLLLLLHAQCDVTAMRRSLVPPARLRDDAKSSDVLKAHMHNGDVYVFSDWSENPAGHVTGFCNHYNPQRRLLATGQQTIAIDSVVIFETNRVRPSGSIAALTVITGISLAMTAICIANPKTCFGSCPTFYVLDRPDPLLQAEGFSSSIAPCLEATDCDALYRTDAAGAELAIRMNNEALETHVVRRVDLLCVPRPDRGRVYTTADNRFFAAAPAVPLSRAVGSDGDCTTLLDAFDGIERKSNADPESLVSPETIDLYFDNPPTGPLGLVIATRQSLLSTYLFYQSLAYLGTEAGAWMASLERGRADAHEGARALGGQLGQIAVAVQSDAGDWDTVSSVGETGPLATNTYVVPLPEGSARDGHVRLTMTRGHWRIDYCALVLLLGEVDPVRIAPHEVYREGRLDTAALASLRDSVRTLVTFPGDVYELRYRTPIDLMDADVFLETRGYYLEWMREAWFAEQNLANARTVLTDPRRALRQMAPAYKAVEGQLDSLFWGSRYAR